jgi:dTDP-D-glucose 4,6-dehydratase
VTVREVANMVSYVTGARMNITQREDDRSYSIDSSRIARVLDFVPRFSIESAIYDLYSRFKAGYWKDAMQNTNYMNVRREALEKAAIVQPNTHVKERG